MSEDVGGGVIDVVGDVGVVVPKSDNVLLPPPRLPAELVIFNSIQYVYCRHNGQLQKYKIDIRHIYIKRKSISKSN